MRRMVLTLASILSFVPAGAASAEGFPPDLVRWTPVFDRSVFGGEGGAAWDRSIRERGWILIVDGTYHLWYTGYNDDRSSDRFLGHATSADGVHWDRDPTNPIFDRGWVEDVCVVRQAGEFVMFAEGKGDVAHMLTSPDGVRWTEHGPLDVRKVDGTPIAAGPYGTPTVLVEGRSWHLFYERGDRGVWLATSTDRRTWTNLRDEPVLATGPDPYDREAVALNQVVRRDGTYYAFYHANARRPWADWTTNVARSPDLIHWEKFPGNPIIADNHSSGILVDGPAGHRFYTMHPSVWVFENPSEGAAVNP